MAKRLQADLDAESSKQKQELEKKDAALAAQLQHEVDAAKPATSSADPGTKAAKKVDGAGDAARAAAADVAEAAAVAGEQVAKRRRLDAAAADANVGAVPPAARVPGALVSWAVEALPAAAPGELWVVNGEGLDVRLKGRGVVALRCKVVRPPAGTDENRCVCLQPDLKDERLPPRLCEWNATAMSVLGAPDVLTGAVVYAPYRQEISDPLTEVLYQGTVYAVSGTGSRRLAHVLFDDDLDSKVPAAHIVVRSQGSGHRSEELLQRLQNLHIIDDGAVDRDD